jgi:hypothetical protein
MTDPANNFTEGFICGVAIAAGLFTLVAFVYLLNTP